MSQYDDLTGQIIEFIKPHVPGGQQVNPDTDLVADLDFDSLKVMKLLETVEDYYDVSIPINVLPEVRTVGDFAQQLQLILKEKD